MYKAEKYGVALLDEAFLNKVHIIDTHRFTNIGDTPMKMTQPEPQASDLARTSQTLTPPTVAL